MATAITAIFHGVKEFKAVTEEIEGRVDKATLAALRVNQNKLKTAVRKNLRGEPRWTQRGANKITGARGNFKFLAQLVNTIHHALAHLER